MTLSENDIVKATKDGKLYIEMPDFFSQDKVKSQIDKLMSSSIYKKIEKVKSKKNTK